MCRMIFSHVSNDFFICWTWHTHANDIHTWNGSMMCDMSWTHKARVRDVWISVWLIHTWHDFMMCAISQTRRGRVRVNWISARLIYMWHSSMTWTVICQILWSHVMCTWVMHSCTRVEISRTLLWVVICCTCDTAPWCGAEVRCTRKSSWHLSDSMLRTRKRWLDVTDTEEFVTSKWLDVTDAEEFVIS